MSPPRVDQFDPATRPLCQNRLRVVPHAGSAGRHPRTHRERSQHDSVSAGWDFEDSLAPAWTETSTPCGCRAPTTSAAAAGRPSSSASSGQARQSPPDASRSAGRGLGCAGARCAAACRVDVWADPASGIAVSSTTYGRCSAARDVEHLPRLLPPHDAATCAFTPPPRPRSVGDRFDFVHAIARFSTAEPPARLRGFTRHDPVPGADEVGELRPRRHPDRRGAASPAQAGSLRH